MLIPSLDGAYPSYFIYGPVVFSRMTLEAYPYLRNRGGLGALGMAHSPLLTRLGDPPDADHEELVIVASPLFPHRLSKGYDNPAGQVVSTVNGTHIRSLAQLVAVLRDLKDEFVTLEFEGEDGESLVFPRAATLAATENILGDNDVRAQGSPDMLKVWDPKGTH